MVQHGLDQVGDGQNHFHPPLMLYQDRHRRLAVGQAALHERPQRTLLQVRKTLADALFQRLLAERQQHTRRHTEQMGQRDPKLRIHTDQILIFMARRCVADVAVHHPTLPATRNGAIGSSSFF